MMMKISKEGSGLARALAHTDKTTRDRAIHGVRSWISKKDDVSRDDALKLWKALYYCKLKRQD